MTIDGHKIPEKAFGLLSEEERNALASYLRSGGHVQRFNDHKKWESVQPAGAALHEHLTYRAAPEPPRPISCTLPGVPIWGLFDESVVALARDENGNLYAFQTVPEVVGSIWHGSGYWEIARLITAIDPGNMPWDESLIVRPGWEGE
jgi:hypothetical protein